jgi:ABC-type multidrug transport system fused ATPase/permease subunit
LDLDGPNWAAPFAAAAAAAPSGVAVKALRKTSKQAPATSAGPGLELTVPGAAATAGGAPATASAAAALSPFRGAIAFQNVSFAYPSRPDVPVLQNLTLEIPVNATYAFVGSSGAGKSTVLALLERFYDASSGRPYTLHFPLYLL